jgi:hypothetical protein
MPEPGLIQNYLATLSGQLPAPVVAELADGLEETHQHYLRQGLDPDAAAEAAAAEFGEPEVIVAAFIQASPTRRTACTLLATGPVVGACWAVALITGRAWAWPVPDLGRVQIGLALLAVIGLLAAPARGTRYRPALRAGVAGCIGIALLDVFVASGALLVVPAMTWATIIAVTASTARVAFSARTLRPILAG